MFRGWLSFGGTEVTNSARTRAYAAEMLPSLRMPMSCTEETDNDNLPAILDDGRYGTPAIDDAPWFDPDEPDSGRFLGLFPLSVSGVTDSTRTATVVESTAAGGSVTGLRRATKEIRVTGLLLAVDDAALDYGKAWLTAVLDGSCKTGCTPDDLCFLAAVPDPSESMGDYTTDPVPLTSLIGPTGRWSPTTRIFDPQAISRTLDTPPAPSPLPCDEVFWHWTVSALAGTHITLEGLSETGVSTRDTFVTTGGTDTFTISDKGQGLTKAYSRMSVTESRQVTVTSVTIEYRLPGTAATCFDKYVRQLRDVNCVAGPTTIEEYDAPSAAMERVEFTLVANVPYVYGATKQIVSRTGAVVTPYVEGADYITMTRTIPVCVVDDNTALVIDPDAPPLPTPPRPLFTTPSTPAPDYYVPSAAYIPSDIVPLWADAVPILELSTGPVAARGVRVRFLPAPLNGQKPEDVDPCGACGNFTIDYIPPNAKFVLNGMEQRSYVNLPGGDISPGDHLLSGYDSDSLFEWPVLSCGTGYWVVLDVASSPLAQVAVHVAVRV